MADPNTPEGRLQALAGQIAGSNLESLIHPAQGATYDFEPQRQIFESILSFYADVANATLSNIPPASLGLMHEQAGEVLIALNNVKNFNVKQGDPNRNFNTYGSSIERPWSIAYNYAVAHIAFAKMSASGIANELQTIRATVNEVRSDWKKASEEYRTQKETADKQLAERISEFEKVIVAAREASGKEAVSRQALEFETEAQQCLIASRWWFGATIFVIAASLAVVYGMFLKDLHKPLTTAITQSALTNQLPVIGAPATKVEDITALNHAITIEALQQTVARILIITLLYSVVVWVARNYFASRHNYTVNRHRRNAMQTFRAFVEGTKDRSTQDFILRQAAACAFAPQQTGYLKDESLPTPAPSSALIDIIKPGGS